MAVVIPADFISELHGKISRMPQGHDYFNKFMPFE